MVEVIILLVIFFFMTAQFQGAEVAEATLPSGAAAVLNPKDIDVISVTVGGDGQICVNNKKIERRGDVKNVVKRALIAAINAGIPYDEIITNVRAEGGVEYGVISAVMKELQAAEIVVFNLEVQKKEAPFTSRFNEPAAVEVKLPKPGGREKFIRVKESNVLTVKVDGAGKVFVADIYNRDGKEVTLDELGKYVGSRQQETDMLITIVDVSPKAEYSRMMDVLGELKIASEETGVRKILLQLEKVGETAAIAEAGG